MAASSERTFCPDLIRQHSLCEPDYLVRGSDNQNVFAARWHQPASYVPVNGATHAILCHHAGGSTEVRKLEDGRQVGSRSRLGSHTFIPTDGTEWQIEEGIEVVHVYLDPSEVQRVAGTIDPRCAGSEIGAFFAISDPWLHAFFQMLVAELETYRDADGRGDSLLLGQLHHVLIRHLLRWHSSASRRVTATLAGETKVAPLPPAALKRVREFVHDRMAEDIGLSELAALAHLSEDHFIRSFRAATGVTPYQYLLRARLDQACVLLRTTQLGVAEVGAAAGFHSPSYFSAWFRHQLGVSPSRYRRAQ